MNYDTLSVLVRNALLAIMLFASTSCGTRRNPDVCCTTVEECAGLGISPDDVDEYSTCDDGFRCVGLNCVPIEDAPDAATDGAVDAPQGRCRADADFETFLVVPNLASADSEIEMTMTANELTAFVSLDDGVLLKLRSATRNSPDEDFPVPTTDPDLAAIVAGTGTEASLWPVGSGLVMYFTRQGQLYVSTRGSPMEAFTGGTPVTVDGAALPTNAFQQISADGETLYSTDGATNKLYAATRTGAPDVFGPSSLMSNVGMMYPVLSSSELTVFYIPLAGDDIYSSTRASTDVPFDAGTGIPALGSAQTERPLFVTDDDCLLYVSNEVAGTGNADVWVARRGY